MAPASATSTAWSGSSRSSRADRLIRAPTAEDFAAYSTLFLELGVDDPPPTLERFLAIVHRMLVFERDGVVIGYTSFERLATSGYVRNLVTAPAARRSGVGAALMAAAAAQLRERGATDQWHLNVKADNVAAIALYERCGMRVAYASLAIRFAWDRVADLPADGTALVASPVVDGEDAEIEHALRQLPERLLNARRRPGRVAMQLRDASRAAVAVACFDPAFPGSFPFATTRPEYAAPLLRAIQPHARAGDRTIQVIIEDDPALADAMIAAGGDVRLRLLHYAGPLP